jgi:hypothetical protein
MANQLTIEEEQALRRTILRASEQGWGIAIGLLLGLGLFLARTWVSSGSIFRATASPGLEASSDSCTPLSSGMPSGERWRRFTTGSSGRAPDDVGRKALSGAA